MFRKNLYHRPLDIEFLEERRLLSVSPSLYDSLRAEYASFGLPESSSGLNLIEIPEEHLSVESLDVALSQASVTPEDDLILMRVSSAVHDLVFESSDDSICIDVDSSRFGSITLLAIGNSDEGLVIDAQRLNRCITIEEGSVVNLGNLTLQNGYKSGSGGAIRNDGTLKIANSVIQNSQSFKSGGAIYNQGTVNLINTDLTGNSANLRGSALYNYNAQATMEHCTVSGNSGSDGTIFNYAYCSAENQEAGEERSASLLITDCVISENGSVGVLNTQKRGEAETSLLSSTIRVNQGGIFNQGTLCAENCSIIQNYSDSVGGAIYSNEAVLTLTNCTIAANETKAYPIYLYYGTLKMNNTLVGNNFVSDGCDFFSYMTKLSGTGNYIETSQPNIQTDWGENDSVGLALLGAPVQAENGQWVVPLLEGSTAWGNGNTEYAAQRGLSTDITGGKRSQTGKTNIGSCEWDPLPIDYYTVLYPNHILQIWGTKGNDWLEIEENPETTILRFYDSEGQVEIHSESFVTTDIAKIEFYALDGNDVFKYWSRNTNEYGVKPTKIYGGDGDDILLGGLGNDLLVGCAGDDFLDGGEGDNRIITGTGKDVCGNSGSGSNVFAWMGSADDKSWVEGTVYNPEDDVLLLLETSVSVNHGYSRAWKDSEAVALLSCLNRYYEYSGSYAALRSPTYTQTYVVAGTGFQTSYNTLQGRTIFLLYGFYSALHEFAHNWNNSYNPYWSEFSSISKNDPESTYDDFVSTYAATMAEEDWAETMSAVLNGVEFPDANEKLTRKLNLAKQFLTSMGPDAETLESPQNVTVQKNETEIQVSWTPVSGAFAYQVEYSTDEDFQNVQSRTLWHPEANQCGFTDLDSASQYYVRVKALGGTPKIYDSIFSDVQTVQTLMAPTETETETEVVTEEEIILPADEEANPTDCDLNADGKIDISDLVILAKNMGTSETSTDFNGDGFVSVADLVIFARNFGNGRI